MGFSITSPDQIIKIEVVNAGCDMIDKAMLKFTSIGQQTISASTYLGTSSLQFGEKGKTNTSFTDTLETITNNMSKFEAQNEGETARVRALAQQQYEEEWAEYRRYLAWLEEQAAKEKNKR